MKPDIHFHDLNWEKSYNRYQAYAQSKLANLRHDKDGLSLLPVPIIMLSV